MKNITTLVILLFILTNMLFAQMNDFPCSYESMLQRNLEHNPNAEIEYEQTENELQRIIQTLRDNPETRTDETYVIPVVMHVFHNGNDGKMDMQQALSGLEIINNDFNDLNDGWDTIDDAFDTVKGTLDIQFCLASIDPQGNPTTGLIYHEDEDLMNNIGDVWAYAWDNYKYLNIYFPKYTEGEPSIFTGYATLPNATNSNSNTDGIVYSSIRWGYGAHSELEQGDDWASVATHEVGHWLNLRHTFYFDGESCIGSGDYVDDTPPTANEGIELEGCYNNDFSCGVATNGSNFMDYNHRCKKMFTQGQVERMEAALHFPSRASIWSEANLVVTGCGNINTSNTEIDASLDFSIYPNPVSDYMIIETKELDAQFSIFDSNGNLIKAYLLEDNLLKIDVSNLSNGIYFYSILSKEKISTGKVVVAR